MKGLDYRGWCFFMLGVLLLGGRSPETVALYLCGIILPSLFFRGQLRESRFPFFGVGLTLFFVHLVFVVNNLIQIPLKAHETHGIVFKTFLAGEFSSTLPISALFLLALGGLRVTLREPSDELKPLRKIEPMKLFCYGMLLGSLILFVYSLVQCVTGFDLNPISAYRPDRLLPNGLYRISGFSFHPVPFAGMALAVMTFFAYLTAARPFEERRFRVVTALISLMHFVLILLSGSRTAALVAVVVLAIIFIYHVQISFRKKLILLGSGLFCCLALFVVSGLIYRFQESLGNSTVSGFGERATFWRVHVAIIAQNPWFGEGSYWLSSGLREAYYNTLGYASFDKKYNAHNIFLQLLADVGVTGCVALIVCMASCARQLKKQLVSRVGRMYYHALRAAFVAELLMGLTQNSLSDAPVMITLLGFFWILVWEDTLVA